MRPMVQSVLVVGLLCTSVCSIPFGYLISRLFFNVDIQTVGSHNIGATNVLRNLGLKAGVFTLALDLAKGYLAFSVSMWYLNAHISEVDISPTSSFSWMIGFVFILCLLSHIYTPFLKGKGGKGIACGFGCMLAMNPLIASIVLVIWIGVVICTRLVSLASVVASAFFPFIYLVLLAPNFLLFFELLIGSGLVIWAHRNNIIKLVQKTEQKITIGHV